MNKLEIEKWEEVGDEEISDEVEVVWFVYPEKNMVGEYITFWYSNAMMDGKPVSLTSDNENDGTSITPTYYTPGHHTKEELIAEHEAVMYFGFPKFDIKKAKIIDSWPTN